MKFFMVAYFFALWFCLLRLCGEKFLMLFWSTRFWLIESYMLARNASVNNRAFGKAVVSYSIIFIVFCSVFLYQAIADIINHP